jgi:putative DNA primase/helicase
MTEARTVANATGPNDLDIAPVEVAFTPKKSHLTAVAIGEDMEERKIQASNITNNAMAKRQPNSRARINITNQDLEKLTKQALSAILQANDPPTIFRHAGVSSRIEHDDGGSPIIRVMDIDRMRHKLARVARWEKLKGKVTAAAMPPLPVVHDIIATPDLPFPILNRIVEAPVFAPNGSIQNEPGYHKSGQTFYAPAKGFEMPAVQMCPKDSEMARARELITKDLLGDFPFTGDTELAHAVGCLLLPFVRSLIVGPTPLHLIEKPAAGTGATLLSEVLVYVGIGHSFGLMTEARDEEEWRKRITAKLMTGPSVILIDNILGLHSSALSAAITTSSWEDRVLGRSEIVRIPVRCAWIATGTNPMLSSEIARRTVRIRLDAKVNRPWNRDVKKFLHPRLKRWVLAERAQLIWAVLTLTRGWIASGRPMSSKVPILGMFEEWSNVIGGILEHARIPGFLQNLRDFYEDSDAEGLLWQRLISNWWIRYGDNPVGVSELFSLAMSLDVPIDLGIGDERSRKTRLGKNLVKMRDRQFGELKMIRAGEKQGAQLWRLQTPLKIAEIINDGETL